MTILTKAMALGLHKVGMGELGVPAGLVQCPRPGKARGRRRVRVRWGLAGGGQGVGWG